MTKPLKPATTFEQQINLLESRGLVITDRERAKEVLSRYNYYKLSGYLFNFRKPGSDDYEDGLTFDRIMGIIEFDRRFRNVLMYAIETVEHTLKTKISYHMAHSIGPDGYLQSSNFRDASKHKETIDRLKANVEKNKRLPLVRHHLQQYHGTMPIWVAIELFTLGMLEALFKNLPTQSQKAIAREFNTGAVQLASWIENVRYLRNMIAHYMRLYDFRLQKTPKPCKNHHAVFRKTTHRVFDIVFVIKALFLDADEWDDYVVSELERLFDEYDGVIELSRIGFPLRWKQLLLKSDPQQQVAVAKE